MYQVSTRFKPVNYHVHTKLVPIIYHKYQVCASNKVGQTNEVPGLYQLSTQFLSIKYTVCTK